MTTTPTLFHVTDFIWDFHTKVGSEEISSLSTKGSIFARLPGNISDEGFRVKDVHGEIKTFALYKVDYTDHTAQEVAGWWFCCDDSDFRILVIND